MAFSHAFIDFGSPPGFEKEATLELANAFFAVRNFDDFRAEHAGRPGGAGGRGLLPES